MMKSKNHKGFMLIELIVVVAIMGIMVGIGSYALSMIASANAKECAHQLNAALVSTRTTSYSKDTVTTYAKMDLYKGTDGIYIKKSFEGEAEKIGGAKVQVYYSLNGGSYTELSSTPLTFSYNRSSGAFRSVQLGGSDAGMCNSIRVVSGTKEYTITCYEQTGKTMVE